jgi:predicted nucleic acid-binding protein
LIVYADTSFLISVYLSDAHSNEADRRMAVRPNLPISPFGRAELANAIYRQVFLRRVSEIDARRVWEKFEFDYRSGLLKAAALPETAWNVIVDLARRFVPTLGVRTLDTLHVACALELRAEKFWTFDERQEKLAQAVGLDTGL